MQSRHRLLILGAAAIILAVTAAILLAPHSEPVSRSSSAAADIVPDRLAGYNLLHVVKGAMAVKIVKSIHWEPSMINVSNAAIAEYGSANGIAYRLWVAQSPQACSLVKRMAERMNEFAAMLPYTAPVRHTLSGYTVYFSLDKRDGRIHAFWCEKDYVIWLEAYDTRRIQEALEQLIRFYSSR